MELYFKLLTIIKFGVPLILLVAIIIFSVAIYFKANSKDKLMKKLGYTYYRGLGANVAYEFQPHWIKGEIKINCKKIDSRNKKEIKEYLKEIETL